MRIKLGFGAACALWLGVFVSASAPHQTPGSEQSAIPTYTRDVAPILFRNCTSCHRPGEIAPMSLMTYEDVRPQAKAIRDEVGEGHMPPWHAEAPHGTFLNELRLTAEEKATLLAWVSNGAPRGNPKDMPPAPSYAAGWTIGKPDAVFEMQEDYKVPADGVVQYEYFYIPTNFTEPKWVRAIEVRPGNRAAVHHVLVYYRAAPDMQRSPVLQPNAAQSQVPSTREPGQRLSPPKAGLPPRRIVASFAPGINPQVMPAGTAMRLEPGGILELQMHYTPTGKAVADRTKVGLVFATEPDLREVRAGQFINGTLKLPAGASDVAVEAEITFVQDATVWGILPHTHLRGKRWKYVLELADGTKTTILDVPRYDFNWQWYYMFKEPLQIPKGAKLRSTAWYDNSAANKGNPDPKMDVYWGDQTWEEMQYTGLLFSPKQPPVPAPSGGVK